VDTCSASPPMRAWGFFPLYFKLLRPAGPLEILAHRIVWSAAFMAVVIVVARRWRVLGQLLRRPRALAGIAVAAALIAINWGTYIYGVNSDQVVETSLGYFINPLVTVALGVLILRERLRRLQLIAVGIGAAAVVVLTIDYGRLPGLALALAITFGLYGLTKKWLMLPAAEGLFVEALVLTLPSADGVKHARRQVRGRAAEEAALAPEPT
jgi:chloramphenicol-sensitive protein RarD